jgi:hypothetical protein
MTLNRLIEPSLELAMSGWVGRSALADVLKQDFAGLNKDRLYRRLYGKRGPFFCFIRWFVVRHMLG